MFYFKIIQSLIMLIFFVNCGGSSNPIFDCQGLDCSKKGTLGIGGNQDNNPDPTPDNGPIITFKEVYEKTLKSCSGCHGQADPFSVGLDLSSEVVAYQELTETFSGQKPSVRFVTSKDDHPDSSYLVAKIIPENTHRTGQRMPVGGGLSQEQIDLIKKWITQGAQK